MEFYNLGSHCHFCRQQDYLPFTCAHCSHKFCLKHRDVKDHKCTKFKEEEEVYYTPNKIKISRKCKFKRCKEKSITSCKKCSKPFCVEHIHDIDHDCVNIGKKRANGVFVGEVDANIKRAIATEEAMKKLRSDLGIKSAFEKKEIKAIKRKMNEPIAFANSISNAKCESKNMEEKDGIVLRVLFPLDSRIQPIYWRFRKDRKIGNLVDKISSFANISNKFSFDSKERYNLYNLSTGLPLPMDKSLKDGILRNGDFVILEKGPIGKPLNENVIQKLQKVVTMKTGYKIEEKLKKVIFMPKITVN